MSKDVMVALSASPPSASSAAVSPVNVEPSAREGLLLVALELFSRRGFADTSVREIVGGAGVTPPTLYYHFRSKEGLYKRLVDDCSDRFAEEVARAVPAEATTADRLTAFARAHFDFVRQRTQSARFVYAVAYGPREHTGFVDHAKLMDRLAAPARKILEANGASKAHEAADLALTFTGMIGAWVQRYLAGHTDALGGRRAETLVDLFLYGTAGNTRARRS